MNRFQLLLVPLLTASLLFGLALGQALAQEPGKQFQINKVLEEETAKDPHFHDYKVEASFLDGYVTLRGYVDNLWQKERLIEIGQAINGSKGVIDKLQIANISIDSQDLAKQVALNLYRGDVADVYQLKIETDDYGRARIFGEADSIQEKNAAEDEAQRVKGVVFAQNEIKVSPKSKRSDSEIQADVEFAFYDSALIDERRLEAEVDSQVATLKGNVGSQTEAMVVESLSQTVPGVGRVQGTELTVVPRFDRTVVFKIDPLQTNYTDEELARLVDQANYYDTRVFSYNIDVEAQNGVIELSGTAQTEEARQAALENAKNTLGVKGVLDNMSVDDFTTEEPGILAE